MKELMEKLFFDEIQQLDISLDDLPVTENYKQKHRKIYYGEAFDYWYEFNYDYGIGVDEESKEVCVIETKTVSRIFVEDGFEKMLQ